MNREQVREAVSDHIPGGSDIGAQEIDEITDAIMALDKPPTVTREALKVILKDASNHFLYNYLIRQGVNVEDE